MWSPFMEDITVKYKEDDSRDELQDYVDGINNLIKKVKSSGGNIQAIGEYLILEDILQVKLSDKTIM